MIEVFIGLVVIAVLLAPGICVSLAMSDRHYDDCAIIIVRGVFISLVMIVVVAMAAAIGSEIRESYQKKRTTVEAVDR